MSSNKSNPLDWFNEDPFFKKQLSLKDLEEQWKLDPNQIEGYVEKVIREATSAPLTTVESNLIYEHIDTHNLLITKITIPKHTHPENIGVQLNRTQIKITGLKNEQSKIIQLPCSINPDISKGTYKHGSLQLKMPKSSSGRFKDIVVRYL